MTERTRAAAWPRHARHAGHTRHARHAGDATAAVFAAAAGTAMFALLALLIAGCSPAKQGDAAPAAAAQADAGCPHAGTGPEHADCAPVVAVAAPAGCEDHPDPADCAASAAGAREDAPGGLSDLDRPLDELLAARCEHAVPTHRCPECRYEVGFVAVPADLLARGLVRVEPVSRLGFGQEVRLTGEVRFDEAKVARLGPQVPGLVRRVLVGLGQRAAAGAPLLELDSPELAEAEAAYLTALAERRLRERDHARKTELRKAGIVSEREYLETGQALESATILVDAGRQRLLRLGMAEPDLGALEKAGIAGATGRYLLRAPFAGEVLELTAVQGEWAEVGSQLALYGDVGSLWLWVDVYEADLGAVSRAQAAGALVAAITVPAYPGEEFAGRVDLVGRTMDVATRTVRARVTLPNPEGKLRPGMFATARLALAGEQAGLAIPTAAVLEDEGRAFVFVRHGEDAFVRRPVRTGRLAGSRLEVLAGLTEGQAVAVDGAFLLKSDVLREKMGEGCAH